MAKRITQLNRAIEEIFVEQFFRLRNTGDGNPRWQIRCDTGARYRTAPNAQVNHNISSMKPGLYIATFDTVGRVVGLTPL